MCCYIWNVVKLEQFNGSRYRIGYLGSSRVWTFGQPEVLGRSRRQARKALSRPESYDTKINQERESMKQMGLYRLGFWDLQLQSILLIGHRQRLAVHVPILSRMWHVHCSKSEHLILSCRALRGFLSPASVDEGRTYPKHSHKGRTNLA